MDDRPRGAKNGSNRQSFSIESFQAMEDRRYGQCAFTSELVLTTKTSPGFLSLLNLVSLDGEEYTGINQADGPFTTCYT